MGTKTCRQHREQEATNCCKLKNTNAHLSGRVLHLSRAFFRHVLVFCLNTFVRSTREYVPLVSLLLLIVQFYLYFLLNAIRVCVLSVAAGFAYQNSARTIGHETGLSGETGTIAETFEFDES